MARKPPHSQPAHRAPQRGAAALATLQQHWQGLARREQTLVLAAAALVGLALLWWLLLAAPLQAWRQSASRHAALDAQWQRMQQLQAQAQALQQAPRSNAADAAQRLRSSTSDLLGSHAQLSLAGEQATLTLRAAPAQALAQWLAQARSHAQAIPVQTRLTRSPGSAPAWDGTLVLALPPG